MPYYARHRDFGELPFCDLVLYPDWDSVRHEALGQAAASDVVIVASYCPEGQRISEEVLGLARPLKAFYDLDTPVTLARFASDGQTDYLHPQQVRQFDLVLSFTGGRALSRLEGEFGARLARPLYGCVDAEEYRRVPAVPELSCDLSYMGTYAPDRQEKLDNLFLEPSRRLPGKKFLLAGTLYPYGWQWPDNVLRLDHVAPSDHPALYSSSRATLNITRKEMADSGYCPSGRFFEAAACGCPILTDTWEGLDTFFGVDEAIRVDSADTIIRALEMDSDELGKFAMRARQRTLEEHSGEHRARQLIEFFEEARAQSPRSHSEVA